LSLDEHILVAEYGPTFLAPGRRRRGVVSTGAARKRPQDAERSSASSGASIRSRSRSTPRSSRHAFLTEQLADLVQTRSDLQTIIADLDERMQTIFSRPSNTRVAFGEVFRICSRAAPAASP
jgi:chromosome segregation protein